MRWRVIRGNIHVGQVTVGQHALGEAKVETRERGGEGVIRIIDGQAHTILRVHVTPPLPIPVLPVLPLSL